MINNLIKINLSIFKNFNIGHIHRLIKSYPRNISLQPIGHLYFWQYFTVARFIYIQSIILSILHEYVKKALKLRSHLITWKPIFLFRVIFTSYIKHIIWSICKIGEEIVVVVFILRVKLRYCLVVVPVFLLTYYVTYLH